MVPVQQEVRIQHKEVCSALWALALQVHQNKSFTQNTIRKIGKIHVSIESKYKQTWHIKSSVITVQ